ncbi:MAG: CDP-alcohol phosphatidyltransferase family protein [Sphingorhabdus sp.]
MFDARLRPLIDPPLNAAARLLASAGIGVNFLTILGAVVGLAAAAAIAQQQFMLGLALVAANRLLDGLDGPLARINGASEFGGYLDSLADFLFYVSIPVGFAFADSANQMPALLLVAGFTLSGVSFLAFAAIAARLGAQDGARGTKAFIYTPGLMEGGETIVFFILMCVMPSWFAVLAYVFAALCVATAVQRIWLAAKSFR